MRGSGSAAEWLSLVLPAEGCETVLCMDENAVLEVADLLDRALNVVEHNLSAGHAQRRLHDLLSRAFELLPVSRPEEAAHVPVPTDLVLELLTPERNDLAWRYRYPRAPLWWTPSGVVLPRA